MNSIEHWINGTLAWEAEGTMRIPMLGDVAAGQPLDVYTVEETLDIPESLWNGRKVFALRVRGTSMIEAGIRNGDYLIVEPCETADDGRTVVAEVDGQVTVKKIYREGDRIRLQPANPDMLPLTVSGEDVRILGIVAGVMRKFGFGERKQNAVSGRSPQHRESQQNKQANGPRPTSATGPARSDDQTFDIQLNAIDTQLARWQSLLDGDTEIPKRDRVRMSSLGRDLQALRDWYVRTSRPQLRRAVMSDANDVISRMQRLLHSRQLTLPELRLH